MPIVINELEVIIEEAPRRNRQPEPPGNQQKPETARALRPVGILHIVAWHERRMERLSAD